MSSSEQLSAACRAGNLDQVSLLACAENVNVSFRGYRPLMVAATAMQVEVVKLLLRIQADPALGNAQGNTALHIAARKGAIEVARVLLGAQQPGILLDLRAKKMRWTALVMASTSNQQEMVEFLLQARADVDATSENRNSAVQLASSNRSGDAVYSLLVHGADHWTPDSFGRSVESYAMEFAEIAEAMKKASHRRNAVISEALFHCLPSTLAYIVRRYSRIGSEALGRVDVKLSETAAYLDLWMRNRSQLSPPNSLLQQLQLGSQSSLAQSSPPPDVEVAGLDAEEEKES